MTNHVHLLVTPHQEWSVSKMMKDLNQNYVQDFNRANHRTGTLWEGRFKSSVVDSMRYLFTLHRYIETNPVRARLVATPAEYEWSSYRANGEGERVDWLTPHALYADLADHPADRCRLYRGMFECPLGQDELAKIRDALASGRALGGPDHTWPLNLSVGMSPQRQRRRRFQSGSDP
jgi:putative transposase